MKSIFENFTSTIIFVIFVFAISAFTTVEMQLMSARHIHSSAINQIQSSYHQVDINAINDKIDDIYPGWKITTEDLYASSGRNDQLVTLEYSVYLPLFNVEKSGTIQGYAR